MKDKKKETAERQISAGSQINDGKGNRRLKGISTNRQRLDSPANLPSRSGNGNPERFFIIR
jgi:hypothetical protein